MSTVFCLGYPKSGTTWLSRLLGDAFNSPVGGMMPKSDGKAIATEGLFRPGGHFIRQGHAIPIHDRDAATHNEIRLPAKIVLMTRDPRDVAVSAQHHWGMDSLDKAMDCMCNGSWPMPHGGGWSQWHAKWRQVVHTDVAHVVTYEGLSEFPCSDLEWTLHYLGLQMHPEKTTDAVVKRQSFQARREAAERNGHTMNYGRDFQLKFLRKGIVGDWKNHFTEKQVLRARECFGEEAARWGYEL